MILILTVLVMAAMLMLVTYFFSFIIIEKKIAHSQALATQTYYLSEAGLVAAIWKIKNDPVWLDNFQNNPNWQATLTKQDPFTANQSYQIQVQNTGLGRATLTATAHDNLGDKQSQRITETTIFQAQGSATSSLAVFVNEDANFSGAVMTVNNADIFANDDLNLSFFSNITVNGQALAVDQISLSPSTQLTAAVKRSANFPPAPTAAAMPQIDFDSADPQSYRNQATSVYTTGQFNQLLNNNPNLVLNGIIYVTGNIIIQRGKNVTVNGVLIADGNINLGTDWWPFWQSGPRLTINDPGSGPVGLLSKRRIQFGSYTNTADIEGLIYATDEFRLDAYGLSFSLHGGIITRNFNVNSLWQSLTLNYSQDLLNRTIGLPQTAPVINIEHWEEEY